MQILRDACRAPSGDNTQPWRFVVRENTIRLINVPAKDTSLFNWQQMTNHVALGACLENLRVSAERFGFRTEISFFPDPKNPLVVAEMLCIADSTVSNDLAIYIEQRACNRKPYLAKPIEPEKLEELKRSTEDTDIHSVFITEKANVKDVARLVSVGERLALENREIHDFLFSHITWTKEEDALKHGFLVDTFELSPPQKAVFKLFSNWNILKYFLPFGISKLIAKDVERTHATSAAFGAITIGSKNQEAYLRAGMALERLWLTATKLNLAIQPTTTVHFIGTRIRAGDVGSFSPTHQKLIIKSYNSLEKKFALTSSEKFAFVFRIGYADMPSGMTSRFEPEVSFDE